MISEKQGIIYGLFLVPGCFREDSREDVSGQKRKAGMPLVSKALAGPLARIIHEEWKMRAILPIKLYKLSYVKKHPAFGLEDGLKFRWEHVEAYRGLGGIAPKVPGLGE